MPRVKIVERDQPNLIHVSEMEEGDLATIVNWTCYAQNYIGCVVQRFRDHLITIGEDDSWDLKPLTPDIHPKCMVEIVKNVTLKVD